jgi:hypothetical protein
MAKNKMTKKNDLEPPANAGLAKKVQKIIIPAVAMRSLSGRLSQCDDEDVMTYGAGASSCAWWTKDRKHTSSYYLNMQWMLGYISAAGNCVDLRKTDVTTIAAFIDNYCSEHPQSAISEAAFELVLSLMKP